MIARTELRYPEDCKRMKEILYEHGFDLTLEECNKIWDYHSSSMEANWLILPDLDSELFEILDSYILKTS